MKKVAKSLTNILKDEDFLLLQDRKIDPIPVVERLLEDWKFDLFSRKPGPAYTHDGILQFTDLDLACFLSELAERNAVINIPQYETFTPKCHKEGQMVVSSENRHGKVLAVLSNKVTFGFSIRIMDANVISSEDVGDFRVYSILDANGDFYKGWSTIQIIPSAAENEFIIKSNILSNNSIIFKFFVAPGRWTSFYGMPYFLLKRAEVRLEEQKEFYKNEISRLIKKGIRLPPGEKRELPKRTKESGTQVKLDVFESIIDFPESESTFVPCRLHSDELRRLFKDKRKIERKLLPKVRFHTRATELAFSKYGFSNGVELFPSWIKNSSWERDFRFPKGRKKWNRLVLFQPTVGKFGVSLLYRFYQKSITVSEKFAQKQRGRKSIASKPKSIRK